MLRNPPQAGPRCHLHLTEPHAILEASRSLPRSKIRISQRPACPRVPRSPGGLEYRPSWNGLVPAITIRATTGLLPVWRTSARSGTPTSISARWSPFCRARLRRCCFFPLEPLPPAPARHCPRIPLLRIVHLVLRTISLAAAMALTRSIDRDGYRKSAARLARRSGRSSCSRPAAVAYRPVSELTSAGLHRMAVIVCCLCGAPTFLLTIAVFGWPDSARRVPCFSAGWRPQASPVLGLSWRYQGPDRGRLACERPVDRRASDLVNPVMIIVRKSAPD